MSCAAFVGLAILAGLPSALFAQAATAMPGNKGASRGDHDTMIGLGVAHAAIGLAIPAVMLTAGLENLLLPE